MALFKICRGSASELKTLVKTDGFCYYTPDDSLFYIAFAATDEEGNSVVNCEPLNAETTQKIFRLDDDGEIEMVDGKPATRDFVAFLQQENKDMVDDDIPTTLAVRNAIQSIQGFAESDNDKKIDSGDGTKIWPTLAYIYNQNELNAESLAALDTAVSKLTTQSAFEAHRTDYNNPHNVTKEQLGLGNVDNTSDEEKPLSDAQLAELATKMAIPDGGTEGQVLTKTADFYQWSDKTADTLVTVKSWTKTEFSL